jgi:hypothetical protein
MNILAIKHIEDCFDGSFIKEIVFNEPIDRDFIFYLGNVGELQYYATFARPFFKVIKPGSYEFKGVEGNRSIRILLKTPPEESLEDFRKLVSAYVAGQSSE